MARELILPLVALLTLAASFGLWQGLRSVPPGETEIIDAAAARYVAETGGAPTDCHATPGPVEGVRLVVVCQGAGADWTAAYDAWGNAVRLDAELLEQEPRA